MSRSGIPFGAREFTQVRSRKRPRRRRLAWAIAHLECQRRARQPVGGWGYREAALPPSLSQPDFQLEIYFCLKIKGLKTFWREIHVTTEIRCAIGRIMPSNGKSKMQYQEWKVQKRHEREPVRRHPARSSGQRRGENKVRPPRRGRRA